MPGPLSDEGKAAFAANLRARRLAKNLTQKALAEEIGTTEQTVGKWENQKSRIAQPLMGKLAATLDTTPDDLWPGWENLRTEWGGPRSSSPPALQRFDAIEAELAEHRAALQQLGADLPSVKSPQQQVIDAVEERVPDSVPKRRPKRKAS